MYFKKYLLFVILSFPCFLFGYDSNDENDINLFKQNALYFLDSIDNSTTNLNYYLRQAINKIDIALTYEVSGEAEIELNRALSSISSATTRVTDIQDSSRQLRGHINNLHYVSSGGGGFGSCSWTTNDVFSLLSDMASIVSDIRLLNDALFDDPNSIADVLSSIYSDNHDVSILVSSINGTLNNWDSYIQKLSSIQSDISDIVYLQNDIWLYLDDVVNVLHSLNSDISLVVHHLGSIINFLGVITYDVGNISTNTSYIVHQLDGLTNRFYYSSRMGYDRFRYYGKPMAGAEIQLTNLAPYDSLNNLQNATIYDIISSGFSSSLISFGSINNYLHFLERAVVSNNDSRIVAHLGAISNLVHRVDDYVLNDFSNEFHTLAVEIDSWYQGGVSNQNQFAISNQLYFSVITQKIDNVSALLQTNNFLLSELTIITNEVGQISTNISWLVDNIRSLELPVTAEFRGDQDTYYDFLTNYYLSGTANDNPSSNWFERVEVLLAALVFSGNSTTNISDTLSDSSSLSQQVETLINTIDFSQDSSNTITLSRNVQQSYINFFHALRNTISSKSNTSTFVLGWGDKDTVTFNDLTSGNFRISISTTEGVFGTFTNIFRSVTTMVWVLFTLFCIYKMGFWLCSRIYSLYSIVRSLIFSLWGK